MKRILTVAGSDSGGGAGIQADLKTITVLGAYGMSAITALTAQNTVGVQGVYPVPVDFIRLQMEAVLSDIGADAAKTGMLATPDIVKAVAEELKRFKVDLLVVDPVMVAKSGDALLSEEARETLKEILLPMATLVTPNLPEASLLSGFPVQDLESMKEAARAIRDMGPKYVLIKGGHLEKEALDLLFDGQKFEAYEAPAPSKQEHPRHRLHLFGGPHDISRPRTSDTQCRCRRQAIHHESDPPGAGLGLRPRADQPLCRGAPLQGKRKACCGYRPKTQEMRPAFDLGLETPGRRCS